MPIQNRLEARVFSAATMSLSLRYHSPLLPWHGMRLFFELYTIAGSSGLEYIFSHSPFLFTRGPGLISSRLSAIFNYQPLDTQNQEIRLVRLERRTTKNASSDHIMNCSIFHLPFGSAKKYKAVSYVWGDPTLRYPIYVNGKLLLITKSLNSLLSELENNKSSSALWIDAICINQSDDAEKTDQVQRMAKIYRKATKVLAWLGVEEDGSDFAMDFANVVGDVITLAFTHGIKDIHNSKEVLQLLSALFVLERPAIKNGKIELHYQPAALYHLFERPFWLRAWIIQEVTAAREIVVLCGSRRIVWDNLVNANLVSSEYLLYFQRELEGGRIPNFSVSHAPSVMMSMVSKNAEAIQKCNLKSIIARVYTGSHCCIKASDPRDYVYALLGMAADARSLGLKVDYSKSCRDVYIDLATAFICNGDLDILSYCRYPRNRSDIPSWVPDWSSILTARMPSQLYCVAASTSCIPLEIQDSALPNIIKVKGAYVDCIKRTGTVRANTAEPFTNWYHDFLKLLVRCQELNPNIDIDGAAWRTPVMDLELPAGFNPKFQRADISHYNRFLQQFQIGEKIFDFERDMLGCDESEGRDCLPYSYCFKATASLLGMSFMTVDGQIGLGPDTMEEGDIIAIIFRVNVPFVLRPVANGYYKVIGECYVYGIMDGEFMRTNPEHVVFELC